MIKFNLNRITMRTYLSERAQSEVTDCFQKRVLTTVVYAFRHFWKNIAPIGHWYTRIDEISDFLGVDDDRLFDALEELNQQGWFYVEQHGDYLWFWLDYRSMSDNMKTELCETMKEAEQTESLQQGNSR